MASRDVEFTPDPENREAELRSGQEEEPREQSAEGRIRAAMESGRTRAGERIEQLGRRIEERSRPMQQEGGMRGRAGRMADRAGTFLEKSGAYLRTHEFEQMREDLKGRIREYPLRSVGIALAAGFMLGRMMRR